MNTTVPGYELHVETPTVDEYLALRDRAGLSPFSRDAARRGLGASLHAVVVRAGADGTAVGMGRLVGDGGCFAQVVDIAVAPEHQRRGLGKLIMQALMQHVETALPRTIYVSLIADGEAHHLYRLFGFVPTAPESIGMAYHKLG